VTCFGKMEHNRPAWTEVQGKMATPLGKGPKIIFGSRGGKEREACDTDVGLCGSLKKIVMRQREKRTGRLAGDCECKERAKKGVGLEMGTRDSRAWYPKLVSTMCRQGYSEKVGKGGTATRRGGGGTQRESGLSPKVPFFIPVRA